MDEAALLKFYRLDSLSTALPDFKTVFVSALTTIKTKLFFREGPTRDALAMGKPLLCPSHITFLNNSGINLRRMFNF